MRFEWKLGVGADPQALARMQRHFGKPGEPMGEAWFMGAERRMYLGLLECDVADVATDVLGQALEAITSGNCCFGPLDEWTSWLHYLLPRVVAADSLAFRYHDDLASAVMAVYPLGYSLVEPYTGFREDLLRTLGSAIMGNAWWPEDARAAAWAGTGTVDWGDPNIFWLCAGGPFSCSMFLCLKYLKPDEMDDWVVSVLAIQDPRWRAALLTWLVDARPIIGTANAQPKEADHVPWEHSFMLSGNYTGDYPPATLIPFVPPANKAAFSRALRAHLDADVLEAWIAPLRDVRDVMSGGPVAPTVQDVIDALNEDCLPSGKTS